jgi:hypothetical protein
LASVPFRPARPPLAALAAVLAVAAGALAGCDSGHDTAPSPSSASASDAALAQLRHQAELAADKSYTATYRAEGSDPPSSGTIEVYRTPTQARLDIKESATTERLVVGPDGTFLCRLAGASSTPCVTLAGPGQPLPTHLDLQLQVRHLFTTAPADIARGLESGGGFSVRPAPARSAQDGLPAASCFAIAAAPASSGIAPGTYCYHDGVLTGVQFRTGSLDLVKLGGPPPPGSFTLPASPVPLHTESPSPR